MQPRFLQTEKDGIDAIQGAEAALGQAAERFAGRFVGGREAELQLFFAALFENAQDVSRLAQIETRERIKKRKDAVQLRVVGCDRRVIDQAERHAVGAVGLAEAIILQVEAAVIVERRAPEHRAVIHHAVIDVADDLVVAEAAGLFRHAQVARIHEADELGRLVIEPDVGVRRIRGRFPELLVARAGCAPALW